MIGGGMLSDGWELFATTVLESSGVARGSVQWIETRRAFYAGAVVVFRGMEKEDMKVMIGIEAELQQFSMLLQAGLA